MAVSGTANEKLFKKQISFITNLIKNYKIDAQNTLVSGLTYSDDARISFKFDQTQTQQLVKSYFDKMNNNGVGKNPKKAINVILESVFSISNGARVGIPKSLILFIGEQGDISTLKEDIDKIKARGVNLIIVAIDGDGKSFRTFVDDPNKLFVFENTDNVYKLVDPVVAKTLPGTSWILLVTKMLQMMLILLQVLFLIYTIPYLDACDGKSCEFYSKCVSLSDQSTECVCPVCTDDEFKPVCGSDGQTYSSACKVKRKSCQEKKELSIAKPAACGKYYILNIL